MNVYAPRQWLPHEKPMLAGSPSTPDHPAHRRITYLIVGMILSITGGLGNALVTVNVNYLQGTLGASAVEVAWLPAAYMMTNVSINLLLVKVRQQFGLRVFTEPFLILYALITFGHLFVNDFNSAIAVRAAHGIAGAALSTLGLLYIMQAFPPKIRLNGLVLALGISQLSMPLARIFSSDLLEFAEWRGLYLFEMGLALISLAGVFWLKLPPGDRIRTFEKLDFLTFGMLAPGLALLVAVLSLGRIVWWLEAPWIGICLAVSIFLISIAIVIEHHRKTPLINTRWLKTGRVARIFIIIMLFRIVLTEQTTGAVGFLQAVGLSNDQMKDLFTFVLLGTIAGVATSAMAFNPKHLVPPVIIALLLVAIGAIIDSFATHDTRPVNMYLSQFLIAFGSALFLGPMLVMVIRDVVSNPKNIVSFSVIFGASQNIGGLLGAALLSTFQIAREKYHSAHLVEHLTLLDPQVAARIKALSSPFSQVLTDPALLQTQGMAALKAIETREANILAYNDTFMMVAGIAIATILWIAYRIIRIKLSAGKSVEEIRVPTGANVPAEAGG
jgi:MFS family permease